MILDHVRFRVFLESLDRDDTYVLAAVSESDRGISVHKLTHDEFVKVLTSPGVASLVSNHQRALVGRLAELQAIVDKRKDEREWDGIQELFHPDMKIVDIQRAVAHLLKVHALAERVFSRTPGTSVTDIKDALLQSDALLWCGRPTQLENDLLPEESKDDVELRATNRGATAEALWQLLDDIDTLSDSIKPDRLERYDLFYRRALDIAKRRHLFLKSNGYKLTWPSGDSVERKSNYTFAEIPEYDPLIYEKYEELVDTIENCAQGYVSAPLRFPGHEQHAKLLRELFNQAHEALRPPVPMLLHCPMCHTRHIDEGEFATKPHHSHACQNPKCGHVWRPAIVPTVGVWTLPGFLNEARQRAIPDPDEFAYDTPVSLPHGERGRTRGREGPEYTVLMDNGDVRTVHRNELKAD